MRFNKTEQVLLCIAGIVFIVAAIFSKKTSLIAPGCCFIAVAKIAGHRDTKKKDEDNGGSQNIHE